jgi:hypothetical protein
MTSQDTDLERMHACVDQRRLLEESIWAKKRRVQVHDSLRILVEGEGIDATIGPQRGKEQGPAAAELQRRRIVRGFTHVEILGGSCRNAVSERPLSVKVEFVWPSSDLTVIDDERRQRC